MDQISPVDARQPHAVISGWRATVEMYVLLVGHSSGADPTPESSLRRKDLHVGAIESLRLYESAHISILKIMHLFCSDNHSILQLKCAFSRNIAGIHSRLLDSYCSG